MLRIAGLTAGPIGLKINLKNFSFSKIVSFSKATPGVSACYY